jgi:glutathione-regulated potassium-efflux system ancillary protein KefF
MIYIVLAHPYPSHSLVNRALLEAARQRPGIEVCWLYDRYPDFDIDVEAEQAALARAGLVVWMHPVFWYSVPGLLKHWFDTVLTPGWAFGVEGTVLRGKDCLWVATTGADDAAYTAGGRHGRPFSDFAAPIEQTARFCGMNWLPPFVVHGASAIDAAQLAHHAARFCARLDAWIARQPANAGAAP